MRINCMKLAFLLLLIAGLSMSAGCRDQKDEVNLFSLEVDTIRVEGGISDPLSQTVTAGLDGVPVSLTGGDFDETVDMTDRTGFTLDARDEAGNTSELTIEVE